MAGNKLNFGWTDCGLLILRVGVGAMMIGHGFPKLTGGPEKWEKLGGALKVVFGVEFMPTFFGFMAAVSEAGGGLLLMLGLLTPVACALLLSTMIVAGGMHLALGDGFSKASHAIELGFVFLGILLAGPGRFSLDQTLFPRTDEATKIEAASSSGDGNT